ncbi:MAG: lycopene beta cyclase [Prochlorococcaceae cyanobacterium]|jgi:lycopene cyclase-like protein
MAILLKQQPEIDVLVVGGGPAALCISSALAEQGVAVGVLSKTDRRASWPNTYGIWGQEVDELALGHLLSHRWSNTVSHFGRGPVAHGRDYGLFEKTKLQEHWLSITESRTVHWWCDEATGIEHTRGSSTVQTRTGQAIRARLVVDASGHQPVLIKQPPQSRVAGQAAYGLVGRFSQPPIEPGQFVFMDYRSDHLDADQRLRAPTFLYAMDLGDDVYFVEETSLALAPPVPFGELKQRLQQRLAHHGVQIKTVMHEEFCLFPMDPPLPDLRQRVVGFGGAGGMVHPASGFMVGSLLRRAPALAAGIAAALSDPSCSGSALSARAWQSLWPQELVLKRAFYRFGLSKLMGFDEARLRHHFEAFFQLPDPLWYGFLTNSLSLGDLAVAMAQLFALASWDVRAGLLLPAAQPFDQAGRG